MYMLMSSGPLTDRKLRAHSVATAFASSVLPVPGQQYDYRIGIDSMSGSFLWYSKAS